jgi:hypothetical protein
MCSLKDVNELIPLLSFTTALGGGIFALCRFHIEGRRQRQIMADGLYQQYLERAMDYPKLSWPEGKIPKGEKYPWFVAIMLNALAAQIDSGATDDMHRAIKADLKVHQQYLESEQFNREGGWDLYPEKLKILFCEVAAKSTA